MAEPAKNQLLRDFRRRSVFDFCNTIPRQADMPSGRWHVSYLPKATSGRSSRVEVSRISWSPILIDASVDSNFNRGMHGESILDDTIHRGEAALGASHHCYPRGGGRGDGADRRRHGETGAPRRTHRGDGATRGGRADHGDRVDQEPAGHFLRCRRLDPARAGVDRHHGTRDASGRKTRHARRPHGRSGSNLEELTVSTPRMRTHNCMGPCPLLRALRTTNTQVELFSF